MFDPSDGTANLTNVDSQIDVDGGTFDVRDGSVRVNGGGRIGDTTFDIAADAEMRFTRRGTLVVYVADGTLTGEPQGSLVFTFSTLAAGPGGATLAVGGTGLQTDRNAELGSTGGAFLNTGLFRVRDNGLVTRQVVLENAGTIRIEDQSVMTPFEGAVLRNRADGTVELLDGARVQPGDGTGRFENAGLLHARVETFTTQRTSSLGGRLRSLAGSELRIGDLTRLNLDLPAVTSLPAGVRVTGDGTLLITSTDFFIEGEVSPGTAEQPVVTLGSTGRFYFSRAAGSPRLVIDVDADGQSDRIAFTGAGGPNFPVRPAGTLVVRVRPGYTPQVGDAFTILQSTSANHIQGTFDRIVAQDAPDGIAFVAEYDNAGPSTITVRAVEVAPGGAIAVSDTAPVGGGVRPIFLSGPGVPGVSGARLVCTECLDPDAFSEIQATMVGEGTVREARFDFTSPRIYGFYDLIVQRPGQPDMVTPITVRPFLSFVVMTPAHTRGIGVRPQGYNWSRIGTHNVTNADAPAYTVAAIDRQDDEQVVLALASPSPFAESDPADGPTEPLLTFGRIGANTSVTLSYGQRVDPSEVLFPEQTSTGPDDDRIPFGDDRLVQAVAAQHASFARMRAVIVTALRGTGDAALDAYLASVETSDPGGVERGIGTAIDRALVYTEGINSLYLRILEELDASVSAPSGLEAVAGAFETALDQAAEDYMLEIYEAINLDSQTAPASVQTLLASEVAALGGDEASRQRQDVGARRLSPEGICPPPSPDRNSPPALNTPEGRALLAAAVARAQRQRQLGELRQGLRGLGKAATALGAACKDIGNAAGGDNLRMTEPGSCSFPPPPPGGPSGGGGGTCSPPSAPADPNDKTALGQYRCEIGTVTIDGEEVTRCVRYYVPLADATTPIVYSIAFENLPQATANAEFVTITDELDANLNPATLRVLATSADSLFSVTTSGQTATFRFVGIDLPPNVNEPEGQGFVTFSVEPRAGLETGAEIRNDAEIVFDFNPPISTPEVIHELRESADLAAVILAGDFVTSGTSAPIEVFAVNLVGDPAPDATLVISLPAGVTVSSATPTVGECSGTGPVTCALGTLETGEPVTVALDIAAGTVGPGEIRATVTTSAFDAFAPNDTDLVAYEVTPVGTEDDAAGRLALAPPAPNPARGAVSLRWSLPLAGQVDLRVFDLLGREVAVLADDQPTQAGEHVTPWRADVASGVYVVRLRTGDEVRTRRVVVVR